MEEEYATPSSGAKIKKVGKQHNTLPIWGNETSMNLNPLILANIQSSSYFKVHLFKLKTYHEVVDEIYYQVKHMEPWERGSRKTSGQTGMCGGVRGVGAGGIVSTAYCLLYKLYTLRLTRKQVNGLLNHTDSPYIRALGFMYLRYTQPPGDLYDWYENYLQDEEEIDVKAGGGQVITIGHMVYQFMTKLDWFSTLFPRIPVPIQKHIEKKLEQYCRNNGITINQLSSGRIANVINNEIAQSAVDDYSGGVGRGSGASSNHACSNERRDRDRGRSTYPPHSSSYRNEHDERDYYNYHHSAVRRRDNYSLPSPDRERHSSKHKKKHKHRHSTRSRSRSRSPNSRSRRHDRKREREHSNDRYDRR